MEALRAVVGRLSSWGIAPDRLYIEVLHREGQTPEEAVAIFAPVGLRLAAVRLRTGRGNHAAVLHVHSSFLLKQATCAALRRIFEHGFPSAEAAREYALGWLDGDGSIVAAERTTLRLAGSEEEHAVLQRALREGFGWGVKGGAYDAASWATTISLRFREMVQLLEAGAFSFSMNRVRLLLAFDTKTAGLRDMARRQAPFQVDPGAYNRWGLVERVPGGYQLSAIGREVCAAHARLSAEIERVRALVPNGGVTGLKGAAYPVDEEQM